MVRGLLLLAGTVAVSAFHAVVHSPHRQPRDSRDACVRLRGPAVYLGCVGCLQATRRLGSLSTVAMSTSVTVGGPEGKCSIPIPGELSNVYFGVRHGHAGKQTSIDVQSAAPRFLFVREEELVYCAVHDA
jgi:hypothetical protein